MSEKSEPNLNEMVAGDGSGLALPPAFVFVNPRQHRKYKKGNQDKVDGRSKGARALFNRIQRRKMKEQLETQIDEAIVSDTERAQKQIAQGKKLNRQKELQSKRKEAKEKLMNKTKEMDTLMKARLSDFKKKEKEQQKKVAMKNSVEFEGNVMMENQDVIQVALDVATSELNPSGEGSFAN